MTRGARVHRLKLLVSTKENFFVSPVVVVVSLVVHHSSRLEGNRSKSFGCYLFSSFFGGAIKNKARKKSFCMVVDEQVEERETADNVATFFVYPRSRQSTLPERPSRADEARRAGGRYTT